MGIIIKYSRSITRVSSDSETDGISAPHDAFLVPWTLDADNYLPNLVTNNIFFHMSMV